MSHSKRRAANAFATGLGATATMDLAAEAIRRTTGVAPLDYRLLARWIGHMPQGRFAHPNIMEARPVAAERPLGLLAHYCIGVGVASVLLALRPTWADRPTLGPAIAIGVGSSAAPFVLMQPAFGLGFAASKAPNPRLARVRTLRTHAIYGIGLYGTALVLARRSERR